MQYWNFYENTQITAQKTYRKKNNSKIWPNLTFESLQSFTLFALSSLFLTNFDEFI